MSVLCLSAPPLIYDMLDKYNDIAQSGSSATSCECLVVTDTIEHVVE